MNNVIADAVVLALNEDEVLHDAATLAVVSPLRHVQARFIAKQSGVACGLNIAAEVFRAIDRRITTTPKVKDGTLVKAGQLLGTVQGRRGELFQASARRLIFCSICLV